jgi:restriction system protein
VVLALPAMWTSWRGAARVTATRRLARQRTARHITTGQTLRDLLGSKAHFRADFAVFVTTTRFSRQSLDFAVQHGILAIHRDSLGLWNSGATLHSLLHVNGAGQGNEQHRARWKSTYSKPPQRRNQPRAKR